MKIEKRRNWIRIGRNFLMYLIGIAVGSVLVWALWLRNRDVPSMWPEGMVKDKIIESTLEPGATNDCYMQCLQYNDSILKNRVKEGNVKFTISKTRRSPAPVYAIDSKTSQGELIRFWIESKDSTYNILKIEDLPGTTLNHLCSCTPVSF